jgi:hypothetical protein
MERSDTRPEPFGAAQIASVADLIRKQQKGQGSTEDDPIHPLDEPVEAALKAANEKTP